MTGTMDRERWKRARAVFEEATELGGASRARFLDGACAGDAELRAEVESLLAADEDDRPFLEDDVSGSAIELLRGDATNPRVGKLVGPYRLLRQVGQGGMGAVYLAERADGSFDQHVAVKLLPSGPYRDELVARFERERDILASLNHPNIAGLLDAGVSELGPYIAMEYVEGAAIDAYCDASRLTVDERLRLFR
ncbi:MAG: protein kinase, partial [Gemmatimonadetes bacterium]|nr:protein kinase [Gemmatimonadota bacterium]